MSDAMAAQFSALTGKKCIVAIEGNRRDGALDTVAVDLNATVAQEKLHPPRPKSRQGATLTQNGYGDG